MCLYFRYMPRSSNNVDLFYTDVSVYCISCIYCIYFNYSRCYSLFTAYSNTLYALLQLDRIKKDRIYKQLYI